MILRGQTRLISIVRWGIWARDANGENARRLTSEGQSANPSVSPDGTQIAFISDRAGGLDIWKMPVTGGTPTRVTNDGFAFRQQALFEPLRPRHDQPRPTALKGVEFDRCIAQRIDRRPDQLLGQAIGNDLDCRHQLIPGDAHRIG